jgi:hypothetical protein
VFPIAFYISGYRVAFDVDKQGSILYLVLPFLGIGMAFALVELLMKMSVVRRFLVYLGPMTIGLYPAHCLWLKIGIGSGIIMALSATVTSLLLSIVVVQILQRLNIARYLFLGAAQDLVPKAKPPVSKPERAFEGG